MLDDGRPARATDRAALAQYGIHVVDVRIKRLNLPGAEQAERLRAHACRARTDRPAVSRRR